MLFLKFILAMLPILWLIVALSGLKMPGHKACVIALVISEALAIPASMLVGVGLDPMSAVISCLAVNSTPTAFGPVGVPTVTLASVSGTELLPLAGSVATIQFLLTLLSPFLMVFICGRGLKALKGMIPLTLVASASFTIPWYFTARLLGPELPGIVGSLCAMGCMLAAIKLFPPKENEEYNITAAGTGAAGITLREGVRAGSSFILIFLLLTFTSTLCPPIHNAIAVFKSSLCVYAGEGGTSLTFSWINTPGVMIFLAAIIGGLIQGASFGTIWGVFTATLKQYWKTILTICSVMATAKIMGYSGMISDIANFLVASTGQFYPLIAPLIGALGAFVTGSGISTCVLFGGLQSQTAIALGLSPTWLAASNIMGAGIGKMVCPQGIAIGAGAIGAVGSESKILSGVFKYFLLYVVLAGIICYAGSLMGI